MSASAWIRGIDNAYGGRGVLEDGRRTYKNGESVLTFTSVSVC